MAESTLNLRITAEDGAAMQAFLRMTQQQMRMAQLMDDVNARAGRAGQSVGQMGTATQAAADHFRAIAHGAAGMVLGLASLPAIIGMIRRLADGLREVRDIQADIAGRGAESLALARPLAEQMGDTSPAGLTKALEVGADISLTTGAELEVAIKAAQAVRSMSSMQQASPDELRRIAQLLAGTVAKGGGDAAVIASIAELLNAAGVSTPDATGKALANVQGALLASPGLSLGAFGQAATKGILPMLMMGVGMPEAMATFAQARQVSAGSEDAAAELLSQVTRVLLSDKGRDVLRQIAGVSKREAADMPLLKRFEVFGAAIARAEAEGRPSAFDELVGDLPARQRINMMRLFSDAARRTRDAAQARITGFRPEDLEGEIEGYGETVPAQMARSSTRRRLGAGRLSVALTPSVTLQTEAQGRMKRARQQGEIGPLGGEGADWMRTVGGDALLHQQYAARLLLERLGVGRGYAESRIGRAAALTPEMVMEHFGIAAGQVPESIEDVGPEARAKIEAALEYQRRNPLGVPWVQPAARPAGGGTRTRRQILRDEAAARRAAEQPAATQPAGPHAAAPTINNFYGDIYDFGGRRDLTAPGVNGPSFGFG